MPVLYQARILRRDLYHNPESRYIFSDDMARSMMHDQTQQMRGEPNAIGIVTKWSPNKPFTEPEHLDQCHAIDLDLELIEQAMWSQRLIIFPSSGIGLVSSRMNQTAPSTWAYLCARLEGLGIANPLDKSTDTFMG